MAAIGIAGFVAGTLDILQACILFGWDIPKVIAAGLLGPGVIARVGRGFMCWARAALLHCVFGGGDLLWG